MNWRIDATSEYISQISKLHITIQENILQQWIVIAKFEDISYIKGVHCPQGHDYYKTILKGLEYEFIFQIDENERVIELINCKRMDFLNHGQVD